jgi:hypothetical protein
MALMNCDQVREELELSFGTGKLSEEISRHLAECESCRAYQAELIDLASNLGDDLDAGFTITEIEQAVRGVEERIAPVKAKPVISLKWFQPVVRLAAAAMIVLVAYGSYEFGKSRVDSAVSGTEVISDSGYGSVTAFLQSDEVTEMDDDMVSVLINEYSTSARIGADEALLGDITAEELEYLTKNLEVGELL